MDAPKRKIRRAVGLKLDADLLKAVDKHCKQVGASRTAFIEYALHVALDVLKERKHDRDEARSEVNSPNAGRVRT